VKKLTIAPLVIGAFLAACGGGGSDSTAGTPTTSHTSSSASSPANNSSTLIGEYIDNADTTDKASVQVAFSGLVASSFGCNGAPLGQLPGVVDSTIQSFLNNVVEYVTNVNKTTPITVSDVVELLQQQEQMDMQWIPNVAHSVCGNEYAQGEVQEVAASATPTIKNLYANAIAQIEAL